jgi:hypothetical protein
MGPGDRGRKIQHAKALKTLGRIFIGILPFCHPGFPELL